MVQTQQTTQLAKQLATVRRENQAATTQLETQVANLQKERTVISYDVLCMYMMRQSASNTLCTFTHQCIICFTAAIDVIIVPCAHLAIW